MSESLALGLSTLLTFVVMLGVSSFRRRRAVRFYLMRSLPVDRVVWSRAEKFLDGINVGLPGLPLFDILYSAFKRDVSASNAIAKLSAKENFETAHEAIEWIKKKVPSLNKKGSQKFILEELIFERSRKQTPQMPTHDPVDVSVVPESSEHHDLDFADYVPVVTLVYSAMRNGRQVWKGNKGAKAATGHVLLDTAGRSLASFGGAKVGFLVGASLAPFTGGASALVIPAATTVLGSILGSFGGKGIVKYIKDRPVRQATAELMKVSGEFFTAFEYKQQDLMKFAMQPYEERRDFAFKRWQASQSYLGRLFFPTVPTKFFFLAVKKLNQECRGIERFYGDLLAGGKGMRRKKGGLLIFSQGKSILHDDADLLALYTEVEKALGSVENARRQAA